MTLKLMKEETPALFVAVTLSRIVPASEVVKEKVIRPRLKAVMVAGKELLA